MEHVIFGDGAGGDAFGRVGGEVFIFVEEALLRYVGAHILLSVFVPRFGFDGMDMGSWWKVWAVMLSAIVIVVEWMR